MEEAEMTRWYVIHTQAQAEARGLWQVTNEGIHCFLLANGPHPLPRPAQPSRDASHRMRFAQRDFTRSDGRIDQGNAGLHQERRGQMGEVTKIFAEGRDRVLTLLGAETELQLPSYAIEAA